MVRCNHSRRCSWPPFGSQPAMRRRWVSGESRSRKRGIRPGRNLTLARVSGSTSHMALEAIVGRAQGWYLGMREKCVAKKGRFRYVGGCLVAEELWRGFVDADKGFCWQPTRVRESGRLVGLGTF